LPPAAILLVNPGVALPTRDVFAGRRGPFSQTAPLPLPWRDLPHFVEELLRHGNDLTDAAVSLCPAIADVVAFLGGSVGARYAAMSGSGATCFALYDTLEAARQAVASAPAAWWRHVGTFAA
jgi:4-diphosphocytidyl-2-C-methyl-D-erythritol kinase